MPVTVQKTVSYYLTRLDVDMTTMSATVKLTMMIDGNRTGEVNFVIAGDDFHAYLAGIPQAGMSRGDDATFAIYEYAVAHGHVEGSIA